MYRGLEVMLSPTDIQNKELKKSKLGGYNIEEVNEFIEEVSKSYQESINENYALKDKINALNESIQYYQSMESTIQNVLVLADKTAQDTKGAANVEADKIVQEAKLSADKTIELANQKAESTIKVANEKSQKTVSSANEQATKIIKQCKQEALELTQKIEDIKRQYLSYKVQFKQLLQSQSELLEQGDAYATIAQEDNHNTQISQNEVKINRNSNQDKEDSRELQYTKEYTPVTDDEISSLLGKAE